MRIENVVCPFCGCLCDDIVVEVEDNRITAAKKACTNGRSLFLNAHTQDAQPTVDGEEVEWPQAIDAAARFLTDAAYPLIYGLSSTASEAQRKAIALADLLGATIDGTSSVCHGPTCADCYGHCAGADCSRPIGPCCDIWAEDPEGRKVRFCRDCYERAVRKRCAWLVTTTILSPFIRFET